MWYRNVKLFVGWVIILGWVAPTLGLGEQAPDQLGLSESELRSVEVVTPKNQIAFEVEGAAPMQARLPEDAPVEGGIGLQEILDIALRQSPELAVQRSKLSESRMRALATGLLPNPKVGSGTKKVSGGHSGPLLEISQELPINGVRKLDRRSANLAYTADQNMLLRSTQVILVGVQRAYLAVLTAVEGRNVESRAVEISRSSRDIATDRFNSGIISSLPYNLARAEYSNALKSLNLVEKDVLLARQSLARSLGMEEPNLPPIRGNVHDSLLPLDLDPSAFHRPDKTAASLRVQSSQVAVSAAQRARIPNPVLGYEREEADEVENFFRVGIEIPILNTGVPFVRQRMAEAGTVRSERDALNVSVESERNQARERLVSRQEAVRVYEEEIRPSIDQSLEAARSAFQTGVSDLSLLIQTQERLIEMERGYVTALRDFREAELEFLLALGIQLD